MWCDKLGRGFAQVNFRHATRQNTNNMHTAAPTDSIRTLCCVVCVAGGATSNSDSVDWAAAMTSTTTTTTATTAAGVITTCFAYERPRGARAECEPEWAGMEVTTNVPEMMMMVSCGWLATSVVVVCMRACATCSRTVCAKSRPSLFGLYGHPLPNSHQNPSACAALRIQRQTGRAKWDLAPSEKVPPSGVIIIQNTA